MSSLQYWLCLSVCEAGGSGSEELKKCPTPSPAVLWLVNVRDRNKNGSADKESKKLHLQDKNIAALVSILERLTLSYSRVAITAAYYYVNKNMFWKLYTNFLMLLVNIFLGCFRQIYLQNVMLSLITLRKSRKYDLDWNDLYPESTHAVSFWSFSSNLK